MSFQIQAAAQGGLLTHQDTVNGFTVNYPASWNKQDNVYGTHGVQLSPNLELGIMCSSMLCNNQVLH